MWEIEYLRQTCNIAGSLLLKRPEQELIDWYNQCTGSSLTTKECQQAFYDYFYFPQSGLFCPPYNHVFKNAKCHEDIWQFPEARFDGGVEEEAFYQQFNFHPSLLSRDLPMVQKHVPGDHFGVELLFLCAAINEENLENATVNFSLMDFIRTHLPSLKKFCHLLSGHTNPYIMVVVECLQECLTELSNLLNDYHDQVSTDIVSCHD